MVEVRATRRQPAQLELTVLARYFAPSEVELLNAVIAGTDRRTRRLGSDLRLCGYALGALVDAIAANQLERSSVAERFLCDFVHATYDDPDGDHVGESFDEDSYDRPDDAETPEREFVIRRFIVSCVVASVHDVPSDEAIAAGEAVRWAWDQIPIAHRPHFVLVLALRDDGLAQLFDGKTWSSAYSLR